MYVLLHVVYLFSAYILQNLDFRPDYKPQILSNECLSSSESIIIDKALIHEYALQESGLRFQSTESGSYVLDGRLQYVGSSMSTL
jgi:hypothetical protein